MANLLTTREAANLLGVTVKTVNQLARRGLLETEQKVAGKTGARLFRPADIERLKKARERAA